MIATSSAPRRVCDGQSQLPPPPPPPPLSSRHARAREPGEPPDPALPPPSSIGVAELARLHPYCGLSRSWFGTVVTCGTRPGAGRAGRSTCRHRSKGLAGSREIAVPCPGVRDPGRSQRPANRAPSRSWAAWRCPVRSASPCRSGKLEGSCPVRASVCMQTCGLCNCDAVQATCLTCSVWARPARFGLWSLVNRVGRVAKSLGSLKNGGCRSLNPKAVILTTILDWNHHHPSDHWTSPPLYRKHWSEIYVKYVYIYE